MKRRIRSLSIIVILVCVVVGGFRLDTLPAAWYGDISIVHEYVRDILTGRWPFFYSQSAGPLYHYFISPGIAFMGASYVSYKAMSVTVGILGVMVTMALSAAFVGASWGVVAGFLTGTSFWYVVWERTGNSQIIISVLSATSVWLAFRFFQSGRTKFLYWGTAVSLCGFFIYPQTWVVPFLYAVLVVYSKRRVSLWPTIGWIGCMVGYAAAGLYWVIVRSGTLFSGGYVGSKLWPVFTMAPLTVLKQFFFYFGKTALMMHIRGDGVFRVNVPGSPQLDIISGVLFLVGLLWWMRKKNRRNFVFLWLSMLILVLPSISPVLPVGEIPNSGRTIGIVPFVMILVATGLREVYKRLGKVRTVGLCTILAGIVVLNGYKYFVLYPKGLPSGNTPTARVIARYIDTIPSSTPVYLSSCCWQDWGQPEPKAIYYQLRDNRGRQDLLDLHTPSCEAGNKHNAVIIDRPDASISSSLMKCIRSAQTHYDANGHALFTIFHMVD